MHHNIEQTLLAGSSDFFNSVDPRLNHWNLKGLWLTSFFVNVTEHVRVAFDCFGAAVGFTVTPELINCEFSWYVFNRQCIQLNFWVKFISSLHCNTSKRYTYCRYAKLFGQGKVHICPSKRKLYHRWLTVRSVTLIAWLPEKILVKSIIYYCKFTITCQLQIIVIIHYHR